MIMKQEDRESVKHCAERPRSWKKPELERVGDLKEVILGGGGKLSIAGGDPGENRKPSGGE